MSNYYETTLNKVKTLCKNGNKNEAMALLDVELKMPYIPKKYEDDFLNLYNNIDKEMKYNAKPKGFSNDAIIDMLFSNDEEKEILALRLLDKVNLRLYVTKLKQRLETWTSKQKITILFELMNEQEIDVELSINNLKINPKYISVFKYNDVSKFIKKFEEKTEQTPQFMEIVMTILSDYIMNMFPVKIVYSKELVNDFMCIAKHLLDNSFKLNSRQENIKLLLY